MRQTGHIDYRFKLLYAIGIIMVVGGHCNGGGFPLFTEWFPYRGLVIVLFAFCSGYFYKSEAEQNVINYAIKKIRSLVIPLYVYTVIYGVVSNVLKCKGLLMGENFTMESLLLEPITDGHQFIYNMGGWFIVPLFMTEILNVVMRKTARLVKLDLQEWHYMVICISLGIIGNQLACMGYNSGWWLALVRMLHIVPFYELGILYNRKLESYDKEIPSFYYFAVIIILKLALMYHYGRMLAYTPSWCNDFIDGPVMPIIIGCLGIAFWMRIANILGPIIGRSKWVNLVADNTYSIMMNQFMGFMVGKTIFACMSRKCKDFSDFEWLSYKTDIWYYYVPKGLNHTMIIYMALGIVIPIMIQKTLEWFGKDILKKNFAFFLKK